jgi:hypothetical protein
MGKNAGKCERNWEMERNTGNGKGIQENGKAIQEKIKVNAKKWERNTGKRGEGMEVPKEYRKKESERLKCERIHSRLISMGFYTRILRNPHTHAYSAFLLPKLLRIGPYCLFKFRNCSEIMNMEAVKCYGSQWIR